MDFATGLNAAYKTRWSYVNTFQAKLNFSDFVKKNVDWSIADGRDINIFIKTFNTPEFTNQPIESYIADRWRIHNGRNEMWRFSIGFRDSNQLQLYRRFVETYSLQRTAYFDECKMDIVLTKDADYIGESDSNVFEFKEVLIESISQIQFSNETESQIAEFDVQFKCALPEIV